MKNREELKQLRIKDLKELTRELDKEYNILRNATFDRGFRKLKDLRAIKKSKQRVARIWTIIGEKINAKSQNQLKRKIDGHKLELQKK